MPKFRATEHPSVRIADVVMEVSAEQAQTHATDAVSEDIELQSAV